MISPPERETTLPKTPSPGWKPLAPLSAQLAPHPSGQLRHSRHGQVLRGGNLNLTRPELHLAKHLIPLLFNRHSVGTPLHALEWRSTDFRQVMTAGVSSTSQII